MSVFKDYKLSLTTMSVIMSSSSANWTRSLQKHTADRSATRGQTDGETGTDSWTGYLYRDVMSLQEQFSCCSSQRTPAVLLFWPALRTTDCSTSTWDTVMETRWVIKLNISLGSLCGRSQLPVFMQSYTQSVPCPGRASDIPRAAQTPQKKSASGRTRGTLGTDWLPLKRKDIF